MTPPEGIVIRPIGPVPIPGLTDPPGGTLTPFGRSPPGGVKPPPLVGVVIPGMSPGGAGGGRGLGPGAGGGPEVGGVITGDVPRLLRAGPPPGATPAEPGFTGAWGVGCMGVTVECDAGLCADAKPPPLDAKPPPLLAPGAGMIGGAANPDPASVLVFSESGPRRASSSGRYGCGFLRAACPLITVLLRSYMMARA